MPPRSTFLYIMVMATGLSPAKAQSPEDLYRAGAFRVAGDSFAARALENPDVSAHWYNLGNALYRAGDYATARAAWIKAARLAPRTAVIREALRLVAAPDASSAGASDVTLLTPGEIEVIGIALWTLGWLLVGLRRSRRVSAPVVVAGTAVLVLAAAKIRDYQQPIALIRHANTALRAAPFASAPIRRAMEMSATVEVLDRYAGWALVKRGVERGWVRRSEIVPIGSADVLVSSPSPDLRAPQEGGGGAR